MPSDITNVPASPSRLVERVELPAAASQQQPVQSAPIAPHRDDSPPSDDLGPPRPAFDASNPLPYLQSFERAWQPPPNGNGLFTTSQIRDIDNRARFHCQNDVGFQQTYETAMARRVQCGNGRTEVGAWVRELLVLQSPRAAVPRGAPDPDAEGAHEQYVEYSVSTQKIDDAKGSVADGGKDAIRDGMYVTPEGEIYYGPAVAIHIAPDMGADPAVEQARMGRYLGSLAATAGAFGTAAATVATGAFVGTGSGAAVLGVGMAASSVFAGMTALCSQEAVKSPFTGLDTRKDEDLQEAAQQLRIAVATAKACKNEGYDPAKDQRVTVASTLALQHAQAVCGITNSQVREMSNVLRTVSPHSADTAWLDRTVASLILNGVFGATDEVDEDNQVIRYGLKTLLTEGQHRDWGRNIGGGLVGYFSSFGMANATSGALAASPIAALAVPALIVGFGPELGLNSGLVNNMYTATPTEAQKGPWHTATHCVSYWGFGVFHTALDLVAPAADIRAFNVGYWRVASGAMASISTQCTKHFIDTHHAAQTHDGQRSYFFESVPTWCDADNEKMPELIASLKQSTFVAHGKWLKSLMNNMSPATVLGHHAAGERVRRTAKVLARAGVRTAFAGAIFAPRTLGVSPEINPMANQLKESRQDLALKAATNFGLALWEMPTRVVAAAGAACCAGQAAPAASDTKDKVTPLGYGGVATAQYTSTFFTEALQARDEGRSKGLAGHVEVVLGKSRKDDGDNNV
ncbi:hypothetical protein [Ramlibacter albus]|uniref:Uncharacterized protein n=1 Tax=Ramlibacter albus TaxID=2079448 RepID=A0A923M932_9BURK|nr:hypothetical protein [Ramlibacter albus]MBC5765931.1 hypothetical protein [Ramlibacter albus]